MLAPELATENLHNDVRATALQYFEAYRIAWWLSKAERAERRTRGITEKLPSGHLNSSQVACVNHLEPARINRKMALHVARNLDPRIADVRDTGEDGYVAFEWIGQADYLEERGARTRGANVTSLDALIRVARDEPTSRRAARWAAAQRRPRPRRRTLLPPRLGRRTSRACRWYRQQRRRP
jgi:hypothetical protein